MIHLISLLEHAYKRRKFYRCDVEYVNRPTFSGLFPIFELNGKLKLGRDVNFMGVRVRSHITVFNPDAILSIGDCTALNDGANICAVESIEIGRHCAIGDWVTILDTAFHPVEQGGGDACGAHSNRKQRLDCLPGHDRAGRHHRGSFGDRRGFTCHPRYSRKVTKLKFRKGL